MHKLTSMLQNNPPVVMSMINIIIILVVYLTVYHYNVESSSHLDVVFHAFLGYISSKFLLNILYMAVLPPKCILDADNRSCRF